MSIRVHVIPNRSSPPAVLLRKTWREGKRIRRQTLANLSKVPQPVVDAIRAVLQGGVVFTTLDQAVTLQRSLPHGHVAALLGLATQIGLPRILHRKPCRQRDLALAALIARLIHPASKLATARGLSPDTTGSSLGVLLGLGPVSGNEMLDMLDWLRQRQPWIEKSLAHRHLQGATLILYDVTSTYLEGQHCPLAAFGHNRDGKKGKKQMVFGLLCAADGCPVAVEVFPGNTADPTTLAAQIGKIRERFRVGRIALVGDRDKKGTLLNYWNKSPSFLFLTDQNGETDAFPSASPNPQAQTPRFVLKTRPNRCTKQFPQSYPGFSLRLFLPL